MESVCPEDLSAAVHLVSADENGHYSLLGRARERHNLLGKVLGGEDEVGESDYYADIPEIVVFLENVHGLGESFAVGIA